MKLLGISFAPLDTPLERRLQTFAVILYELLFLVCGTGGLLLCAALLLSPYFLIPVAYLIWMWFDRRTSRRGGRRFQCIRKLPIWRRFRDYFPVHLIKTADLDPDRNYIFGYHPHGILGIGAFCNFATEGTRFSTVFPGIKPRLLTLQINFRFPIYRDYLMALGMCSVSADSISNILTKHGNGNAAVIVVGGAAEAMDTKRRQPVVNLTLKRRKGFVRMALIHGASLVPVFCFGENELFSTVPNPEGSIMRSFQDKFKRLFGFIPIFIKGRGILQYNYGFIPYRCPIYTVVGKPIHVEKTVSPSQELVDKYHAMYVESLVQLFDEYKEKIGGDYKNVLLKV